MQKEEMRGDILIMVENEAGIGITEVLRSFNSESRAEVRDVIGQLLGENVLARVGRGVKGDPHRLVRTALELPKI